MQYKPRNAVQFNYNRKNVKNQIINCKHKELNKSWLIYLLPLTYPFLSAIHDQGNKVRQVHCNTLLRGFQPLWPPCFYNLQTPWKVSKWKRIRLLKPSLGHPFSPYLLTRKGPILTKVIERFLYNIPFKDCSSVEQPQTVQSFALPA